MGTKDCYGWPGPEEYKIRELEELYRRSVEQEQNKRKDLENTMVQLQTMSDDKIFHFIIKKVKYGFIMEINGKQSVYTELEELTNDIKATMMKAKIME